MMQRDEHLVAGGVRALHILFNCGTPAGWSRRPNAVPTVARLGTWNSPNRKTLVASFQRFDPTPRPQLMNATSPAFEVIGVNVLQRVNVGKICMVDHRLVRDHQHLLPTSVFATTVSLIHFAYGLARFAFLTISVTVSREEMMSEGGAMCVTGQVLEWRPLAYFTTVRLHGTI